MVDGAPVESGGLSVVRGLTGRSTHDGDGDEEDSSNNDDAATSHSACRVRCRGKGHGRPGPSGGGLVRLGGRWLSLVVAGRRIRAGGERPDRHGRLGFFFFGHS